MIDIYFVLPQGRALDRVVVPDAIRDKVGAEIGDEGPNRWLTICFTEDAEWAF